MTNKIAYLILGVSIIIFILIYIYVPVVPNEAIDYDLISPSMVEEENLNPIYSEIKNDKYVIEAYKGEVTIYRALNKLRYTFLSYNIDILNSDLSYENYYKNNKELVETRFGIDSLDTFLKLCNSFKKIGTNIYSINILEGVKNTDEGINFTVNVFNENNEYEFYNCTIYNKELKNDVIFKIEPYLEVE